MWSNHTITLYDGIHITLRNEIFYEMARLGITYDDVAAAALSLQVAQKSITVDSIREALGSTGSKSTIAPLLKRWRAQQQNAGEALPSSLPPALLEAVTAINAQVQADADARIAALTSAHAEAITELRTSLQEADSLIEKQSAESETSKSQLAELRTHSEILQSHIGDQKLTILAAEAEREGLTLRLAGSSQHIQLLQDQLEKARTQFDHYQTTTAAQRNEERRDFGQHLIRNEHDIKRLREDLTTAQINTAQLETRLDMALTQAREIADQKTELQSAHDSLTGQNLMLNTQVQKLETRSHNLAQMQTASETKLIVAAERENGLREQIAELENCMLKTQAENKTG
jgi:chromosome segregation ATPase